MRIYQKFYPLLFMFFVGGCVSHPPNKITKAQQKAIYADSVEVVWSVSDEKYIEQEGYSASRELFVHELTTMLKEKYKKQSAMQDLSSEIKVIVSMYNRVSAIKGHFVGGGNTVMATAIFKDATTGRLLSVYTLHGKYGADGGLIGAAIQAASTSNVERKLAERLVEDLDKKFHSK